MKPMTFRALGDSSTEKNIEWNVAEIESRKNRINVLSGTTSMYFIYWSDVCVSRVHPAQRRKDGISTVRSLLLARRRRYFFYEVPTVSLSKIQRDVVCSSLAK